MFTQLIKSDPEFSIFHTDPVSGWLQFALSYRSEAQILFKNSHSNPLRGIGWIVLLGLSLEHLVKGWLVTVKPSLVSDGNIPDINHNLLEMIEKHTDKSFIFTDSHKDLLKIYEYVMVHGKYTCHRRKKDHKLLQSDSDEIIAIYDELYDELGSQIIRRNGPNDPNNVWLKILHENEVGWF